ncbi:amino acid ABC transporter permease [Thermoflavimicrobium dichotomicum]|uniref:L-cystine transport system permease protein n=1 Tax=Thermoflavimicrobium dichotomicum TaxID=46223 RepID=A0A1I3U271_9BACL|nr:amino acid ABC transporter permease [Thermoflavimicrobium dichotomicum]SFJ77070.1 L-cystine transport system permease protein [Thermoflavimicrobium dichotomicum]
MNIDFRFIVTAFFEIMKALPLTLVITTVPLLIGFAIGIGTALIRLYKVKVIYKIADFYVSFLRGTPLILHIYIVYLGLPLLFDVLAEKWGWSIRSNSIPLIVFVFVAFSLNAGAYMSEIIRSGILAVNKGEIEAAYSIGMTTSQAMKRIVLPQALMISLPNLCNMFVGLLHGSSLAFSISLMELNGKANVVASTNWKFLESFIAAAVIYWGMTILAEKVTAILEKRLRMFIKGGVA